MLLSVKDLQFDNQLHYRGSYDFPVVLIGKDARPKQRLDTFNSSVRHCIETAQRDPVVKVELTVESWRDGIRSTDMTGKYSYTILLFTEPCSELNKMYSCIVFVFRNQEYKGGYSAITSVRRRFLCNETEGVFRRIFAFKSSRVAATT